MQISREKNNPWPPLQVNHKTQRMMNSQHAEINTSRWYAIARSVGNRTTESIYTEIYWSWELGSRLYIDPSQCVCRDVISEDKKGEGFMLPKAEINSHTQPQCPRYLPFLLTVLSSQGSMTKSAATTRRWPSSGCAAHLWCCLSWLQSSSTHNQRQSLRLKQAYTSVVAAQGEGRQRGGGGDPPTPLVRR